MKQQENKQRVRGDEKSMQHFKFVDYEGEDGQKSRMRKHNQKKHKDGFARWSDYITYDSGQIEIPISDGQSISVSPNHQETSSLIDTGNSKQILPVTPNIQEVPQTKLKYHERERESFGEKPAKLLPSLSDQNDKINQPISPFSIPNISEIKPKESLYSNTRNSQKFLLQLLNQQCERAQQKNKAKEKQKQKELQNNNKQHKKSEANPRKSNIYKQIDKFEQKSKPKEIKEPQVRPKRVTINDRGKIKFPSDSISGQFQYVLPQEFRDNESLKKRRLVIKQQQEDEKEVHNEPMDIVNHKEQQEIKQKAKAKQDLAKIDEKFNEIAKNAPKKKLTKEKNSKIIRVIDNKEDSITNSRNSEIRKSSQTQKKTVQIKSISTKQPKKESLASEEQKVRKFRKEQRNQIEIVSRRQSTPKIYTRPKRYRHQTLPFWKNQKVVYSKQGMVLGITNLTNIAFLQTIGFHSCQNIATSKVNFSPLAIKITMTLKPRQKIYSSGIDQQKMKENKLRVKNFSQIELNVLTNMRKSKGSVKIMIDDVEQADLKETITIKRGQTFSIQNLSASLSCLIAVCFHSNSKRSGQKRSSQ